MTETLEQLLEKLMVQAAAQDITLYEILCRRAGWGIFWHEQAREDNPPDYAKRHQGKDAWRNGLVVHAYYPSLRECVEGELRRLAKKEAA